MNPKKARRLLEIELATGFVLSPSRRMLRSNDPDGSPAPKIVLAGCSAGNVLLLNADVEDRVAEEIESLVAEEAPLGRPDSMPRHTDTYRSLLGIAAPSTDGDFALNFHLPHSLTWPSTAEIVCHGTPKGDALLAWLAREGLSPSLIAMGFSDLSHFWEPWCVVLEDDEIASIAFAARLGEHGAALGLATMPQFRGRGLAAAVTAAWSALPALKDRVLFYGTDRANVSSQRVTQRLSLKFFGSSLRL